MQFCEKFKGIAVTDVPDGKGVIRLRCKQWSCEYCAKRNQSMWRTHLLKTMPKLSDHWVMITVTCMGDDHRNHTTLKRLMQNHDRLMKRLKREYGNFQYVRVYEQHKSEEFHMHILAGIHIFTLPFEWITDKEGRKKYVGLQHQIITTHCTDCKLGEQCDVRPLVTPDGETGNSVYAVRYISKYLTKAVGASMPKGTRRIQTSQKIGSPKHKSSMAWSMKSGVYLDDVMQERWFDLSLAGREITTDDFMTNYVYPPDNVDMLTE